jgi:Tfp pilus assembly protein PilF
MTIRILFTPLLFDLFPDAHNDREALVAAMRSFYTVRGVQPSVTWDGDDILLQVDAQRIVGRERMFREAVALCERRQFDEGRQRLVQLSAEDPTNSEYHRMLGQLAAEQGDPDAAIDHLIDALRWDPRNTYALTMMGNIWARDKDDVDTAMRYYQAALAVNPSDHIAANNIAAQFLQRQDWRTAGEWFNKALAIHPDYPNTHHGLGIVALQQGDVPSAFFAATEALRLNTERNELYRQSFKLATDTAQMLARSTEGQAIVRKEADELGALSGKPVRITPDPDIPTAAKLELAENHGRPEHVVRFKPAYPAVEHLQLHELYHLRYAAQARKTGANQLFIMRPAMKEAFIRSLSKHASRLHKAGYPEDAIARYLDDLFNGLNRQVFNAPVDLFIEWDMYHEHPDIRPYQFVSLAALVAEALQSTTDKRIVELSPADILSKSKVYNLTLAMLYKELYGVDRVAEFKATHQEHKLAQDFYEEFKEYREDRQPAEEYEVVQHWGEDLQLTDYFALVPENEYREPDDQDVPDVEQRSLDEVLDDIEADPLDQFRNDPKKAQEMRTFLKGQKALGLNMAVAMYMVDALNYFKGKPLPEIKQTALEIAILGTQGIHPEKKGYNLASVPGKTFSGYHLLAYYYITWKLAIPEMLDQLQLPYDAEYATALQFFERT